MSFDLIKIHWSNALDFFKLQNSKLFVLATLNNFIRSLKIICTEFSALLIGMIFSKLCMMYWMYQSTVLMYEFGVYTFGILPTLSLIIFFALVVFVTFFFCLAARPSIGLKNRRYFGSFLVKFWGFALFYMLIPELLFPFLIMSVLFFLDLTNKPISLINALINGFKSYIYFLPVTLFLSVLYIIPLYALISLDLVSQRVMFRFVETKSVSDFFIYFALLPSVIFIVMMLYKFLLTSACTIYYVKIKHANHQTFFDK